MRPSADRLAVPAPEPRAPETPPMPTLVAPPRADGSDDEHDDDDDFSGPFAAW